MSSFSVTYADRPWRMIVSAHTDMLHQQSMYVRFYSTNQRMANDQPTWRWETMRSKPPHYWDFGVVTPIQWEEMLADHADLQEKLIEHVL